MGTVSTDHFQLGAFGLFIVEQIQHDLRAEAEDGAGRVGSSNPNGTCFTSARDFNVSGRGVFEKIIGSPVFADCTPHIVRAGRVIDF